MGKNPNAAREKKNHHKDKDQGFDKLDELAEEAARLGCEVWQIEEYQKKEAIKEGAGESGSSQEEETKQAPQKKNKISKQLPKPVSEDEQDSDDAELERMFGKPSDNKKAAVEESDSEEEKPKKKAPKKKTKEAAVPENSTSNVAQSEAKTKSVVAKKESSSSSEEEVKEVPRNSQQVEAQKAANRARLEEVKRKRELDALKREELAQQEEINKKKQEELLNEMKAKQAAGITKKSRMFK